MSQATNDFAVTLRGDREIVVTRVFDAPRELVFTAHTSCQHLKRWWARGNPMDCELDFRPGGSYRIVEHAPDGTDHAFRGEYREITAPERIVQTFEYEPWAGHISVETLVFTEEGGKTTLTTTAVFDTAEDRDGMAQSGMADGARQSYDALAALLAELK